MAVQVKNSTFQMNHFFIAYQTQQLRDLEELDSSGTLATTGPAMIISSVIRIRHWTAETITGVVSLVYCLHCATDKYICMTIEELTAKIRPCERKTFNSY